MITSIETALVVDDDMLMRDFVVETLSRKGMQITQAEDGRVAKRLLEDNEYDIAFIDMKMPGLDGMGLLEHMHSSGCQTLPVLVTAFGTVERAVEAMRMGAYDFLMKPFSPEQVELVLERARDWVSLKAQNAYLREELGWKLPRGRRMIGCSPAMQRLMQQIERVSRSGATVLVTGESGTGKELVALAIHSLSTRSEQPFVRMNCAAVPDSLMDSELFGHEKGSFTGAISRRVGRFELAHNGTLMMDEIGEIKMELQAKLLRVLQEREFERVGGNRTIASDCRVIATTNRDLAARVEEGEFREDLYYRLNVLPLHVPPLRDRREDIPLLAQSFLDKCRTRDDGMMRRSGFSDDALKLMCAYGWPGNVRELENVVERMNVLAPEGAIGVDALPDVIRGGTAVETLPVLPETTAVMSNATVSSSPVFSEQSNATPLVEVKESLNLADLERDAIFRALEETDGSRQEAADILGISVRTLRNKLNQYREEGSVPEDIMERCGIKAA